MYAILYHEMMCIIDSLINLEDLTQLCTHATVMQQYQVTETGL